MTSVEERLKELSTLEEKCEYGKEHTIVHFIYNSEISDYEIVCVNIGCGQLKFEPGLYSHYALDIYLNSARYRALLEFSEQIRNKKPNSPNS